ncbi:hypothetical protein H6G96_37340 [Nostoc sp. FACHB-892]|uniref:hypothetical protein n=1 Tax=Nostoc sp. FACHB-892 TaxID=2692843 RepID=UPI0016879E8A|nr:hypothetical protein [Nostoc sp. FACHB-892]MBD2731790.1 hypothetical protein [Nostoc sp. FACHB-892]
MLLSGVRSRTCHESVALPLLKFWRKTIRLSDQVASYKSQIASVPTTVVVSLKQ